VITAAPTDPGEIKAACGEEGEGRRVSVCVGAKGGGLLSINTINKRTVHIIKLKPKHTKPQI